MEAIRKKEIRRFHTLLMACGIDETGKEGILSAYGVQSSKELPVTALWEINGRLEEERMAAQRAEQSGKSAADKERKRLKVAIGKYLAAKGVIAPEGWGVAEWNRIVQVACRAAKVKGFYEIPLSRLRGLTYEFNKQREAMDDAAGFIAKELTFIQ